MSNQTRKQRWMVEFEAACLKAGVDYEVIHGPGHEEFWSSAQYYFTQGVHPTDACRRFCDAAAHLRGSQSRLSATTEHALHVQCLEDAHGTHGQD